MIRKIFLVLFFLTCTSFYSSAYYDFDKKLELAYSSIIKLHFEDAESLLQQEKIEKPGNDLRYLFLNYIDFLKAFISEENSDFEKLKKNSSIYLDKIKLDKNNSSSPFDLYVQSEILIQLALVRVKFDENILAASEIRKAYKLINRNEVMFPTFLLNRKTSGFLKVIIGSVPDQYHWMVRFAGMEGNISQGLKEIHILYEKLDGTNYACFRTELLFYLGNIYSSLSTPLDSTLFLNNLKSLFDGNPLLAYVFSNVMMKQGKNEEALNILNTTLENYNSFPFTFLYYKRGLARLRKLDYSSERDFQFFISNYKGSNNIKSAYQKLAWISLLKGDTAGYVEQLNHCKEKGNELLDEDKAALDEAESGEIINSYLLRARLYFDGGYYNNALAELTHKSVENFPRYHDQLEITYRLGRIMQMTGKTDKAIDYYEMTLKNGLSSEYYFAANSALMLGLIYEERMQYEAAKIYFQRCLSIRHVQYKNSIDQKAKAGLDRIKGRGVAIK